MKVPLVLSLSLLALTGLGLSPANADTIPMAAQPSRDVAVPPGPYKVCHGFIRHVSHLNLKVHCIDGIASDQSFVYLPQNVNWRDGQSAQTRELHADRPVVVIYRQFLGVKKVYKIILDDENGKPLHDVGG